MFALTLDRLAADCEASNVPSVDVVATGLVTDTRQIRGGEVFAAIKGERVDGATLAAAALEAGASGVLTEDAETAIASGAAEDRLIVVDSVEKALGKAARANIRRIRAEGNPDFKIVAVTGSVGKTTTKDLLARILADRGDIIAPPGSFNNEIGLPLTVLRADENTATLVLEMGADHIGNIAYLTSIAPPDAAAVLIVARAHLGEFGGIDNVAKAKSEMLEGVIAGGPVILNADDERVAAMAGAAHGPVIWFSRTGEAGPDGAPAVHATDITCDEAGHASFTLHLGQDARRVRLGLAGEHHVANALAAAALAHALGTPVSRIVSEIEGAEASSPHRMDVREIDGVTVIDDAYNANPDSMRAGIAAFSTIAGDRRKIAVLGAMLELGEASESEHAALGEVLASAGVDVLVCVGAELAPLHDAAVRMGIEVHDVADSEEALEKLRGLMKPTDTVLLKGSNGSGVWKVANALFEGAKLGKD